MEIRGGYIVIGDWLATVNTRRRVVLDPPSFTLTVDDEIGCVDNRCVMAMPSATPIQPSGDV